MTGTLPRAGTVEPPDRDRLRGRPQADTINPMATEQKLISDVDDMPVEKVLDGDLPAHFVVPKYQRAYVWAQWNWDALFDDLVDENSPHGHFLGTYLAVNQEPGSHKVARYDIVDGQQRLTTLSLLLAALYRTLKDADVGKSDHTAQLDTITRMLTHAGRAKLAPQAANRNHDDFVSILADAGLPIKSPPKTPLHRGNRRIERAYRHFLDRIERKSRVDSTSVAHVAIDVLARVKSAVMVKIEVLTFSDAFRLFESLNNRGKPLTAIELIKNALLARADAAATLDIDDVYRSWNLWMDRVGDDPGVQDRFFRQLYNAMRDTWQMAFPGATLATRSNLVLIYDTLIQHRLGSGEASSIPDGTPSILEMLERGSEQFQALVNTVPDTWGAAALEASLADLNRAEGTTAHILLLHLLIRRERLGLTDPLLQAVVELLVSFSVRRNVTNQPATHELPRLFMDIISELETDTASGEEVVELVANRLRRRSADDATFLTSLQGRIYENHSSATRFILVRLAKAGMTRETWQDLWARDSSGSGRTRPRWTIEHVLPQSDEMNDDWIAMLGGAEAAIATHDAVVHHLGNLTISGYNSSLGKKSFVEKRDRQDADSNPIGYRNGLSLNSDLANRDDWSGEAIRARTDKLSLLAVEAFPLTSEAVLAPRAAVRRG